MPNNYILKDYDGGAERTTLTAAITSTALSFTVVDGSTYPSGSNPFVVVIDRGLATEEKVLVEGRIGNSFSVTERAYDGSSAQSHALGAVVEHCIDAFTVEQANRYVNLQTAKGDLVSHDGTTTQRQTIGSNNHVLMADSAQSNGIKWAQVGIDSIAQSAVDEIASQVTASLPSTSVPSGVLVSFAGSIAPSGWLLCEGQSLSTTTYASLFAAIGYTYGGAGGSFSLPNMKGRVPVGRDTAQGEFDNLGETGGAKTHTLTSSEMPSHNHTGTTASNGNHDHSYQDHPRNPSITYASGSAGQDRSATSATTDSAGAHTHTFTTANTGGGVAHNNLQPYITLNYIIKT